MKKIVASLLVLLTLQSSIYSQNAIPIYFSKLGAYVFADIVTKQPIQPVIEFDKAVYLGFGFWAVDNGSSTLDNRQAFFNYKGKQLTDFKYSSIYSMYEKSPILKFEEDKKFGLIDSFGKELFAAKYQFIDINPKEGIHKVKMNNNDGFVNNAGKEIINCKYIKVTDFSDGLALVDETKEGEEFKSVYFIDKTGKIALKPSINNIENIGNFSEGLAAIDCYWKTNNYGLYGFIDKKGNMVIEPRFTSIFPTENAFKNGYTQYGSYDYDKVSQKHKSVNGIINKKGEIVIEAKYSYINFIGNDMFRVKKDSLYGVISSSGKIIVPLKYKEVWLYSYDKKQFIVHDNNQHFIVDSLNNTIKTFKKQYDRLTRVAEGVGIYRVKQGKNEMFINEQEEVIVEIESHPFRNEITFNTDFIIVRQGSRERYYDLTGKEFRE